MENYSEFMGTPGLREMRDILVGLADQLTHPGTDLGWFVTCCGTQLYLNIDYENRAITLDTDPLFTERED